MFVVPVNETDRRITKPVSANGDNGQCTHELLESSDEPLNDGDAAVLSNRAEAWFDPFPFAPTLVTSTPELTAFVADDIFWPDLGTTDRCAQKRSNVDGAWLFLEYSNPDGLTRPVIHHDCDPPTKRPTLRQSKRKPGSPESAARWHDRHINMPNMVGILGSHNRFCRH
jgi:hypothetical protein